LSLQFDKKLNVLAGSECTPRQVALFKPEAGLAAGVAEYVVRC
jgi:hypothetical protein